MTYVEQKILDIDIRWKEKLGNEPIREKKK